MYKPESMKLKSVLIDNIYGYETRHIKIGDEVYYKKGFEWSKVQWKRKLSWCMEILKGKAIAVHFKEDEV